MKIGILTFHNGFNHGGFFQALGTYEYVKKLGHDVVIINYRNRHHLLAEYWGHISPRNHIRLWSNIKKILYFNKSQFVFNRTPFTCNLQAVSKTHFDLIIIGSDIVWNYEWSFLGNDPIYFGYGLNSKRIISFAASFGAISAETRIPNYVFNGFNNFNNISVRDCFSADHVEKITSRRPEIVIDPSLIVDFDKFLKPVPETNYILVYAHIMNKAQKNILLDFAQSKNLKLIAVGYHQPWCNKNIIGVSPFKWLGYFRNASYVFTSTFHGTLFSIKYNRQFCTSLNSTIANKITDFLQKLDLNKQIITNDSNLASLYDTPIDYRPVNKSLAVQINRTKSYLNKHL
ncbi:MAG: polysaccharide pyruvyl transferase family protein [Candidatus Marinimicrobia bacterium]|nr:polysaccharide pyruvyl transferase family protein [Candidatus Neomarinimicrobiota bacterium]